LGDIEAHNFYRPLTYYLSLQFNSAKTLQNIIDRVEDRKFYVTIVGSLCAFALPAVASISHVLTTICNIPVILSSVPPRLKDISATSVFFFDVQR
jgi:hypothetical protein